jgi:phage N-6-adenine-methyltransferase
MANDLWRTPKEVFKYFNDQYSFECDVAASDDNHLCDYYFTEEIDALSYPWEIQIAPGLYVWCNPPYSNPLPWVHKITKESQENGIGTVMLLNCDMSTKWAKLLTKVSCEIIFITEGRIAFLDGEGKAIGGNNKSQMVIIIPPYVRDGEPATRYLPLVNIMEDNVWVSL